MASGPLPQAIPRVGTLLGPPKIWMFMKNAKLLLELAVLVQFSLWLSWRAVKGRGRVCLLW